MAVHAARVAPAQPNLTAAASAAPSSSYFQQPVKAAHATGMLADDVDDCIDLISQPGSRDPPAAPRAENRCDVAQPAGHFQPGGAGAVAYDQVNKGTEQETVEEIIDDRPEQMLMECSTNLLNPGIRVHKYSFGFLLHALTRSKSLFCMASLSSTAVCQSKR